MNIRNQSGAVLAEGVCTIALVVPLIVMIAYGTIQATNAYIIARNVSQAAVMGARSLSEEYLINKEIVGDSNGQRSIFSKIRIDNFVSSNKQFSIPRNGWQLRRNPKSVTVEVRYIPNIGNPRNPPFPSPDFLGLGNSMRIKMQATYRLID